MDHRYNDKVTIHNTPTPLKLVTTPRTGRRSSRPEGFRRVCGSVYETQWCDAESTILISYERRLRWGSMCSDEVSVRFNRSLIFSQNERREEKIKREEVSPEIYRKHWCGTSRTSFSEDEGVFLEDSGRCGSLTTVVTLICRTSPYSVTE